jgi:chemotaxis regulatin CheY-phosphate phosphatase CheZ
MQPEDFGNVLDVLMELKQDIMMVLLDSETIEEKIKETKKSNSFSDGLTIGYTRGIIAGLKQANDIIDEKIAYLYEDIEEIEKELGTEDAD